LEIVVIYQLVIGETRSRPLPLSKFVASADMAGGKHQAFTYATLLALGGGAGYVLKGHLPSLVGGMALGVGFLGAGMLVLTDTITDHHFEHGTSLAMSGVIAGVLARRAVLTGLRAPALLATAGAMSAGYHVHQLSNPPRKMRYIPGAPPVPSSYD
jgi:uncharacterized membrane protein (UPF0136 family)